MEYLKLTFRIVSVMGLLLFLVLITGRRKISELPVFDFLTMVVLGNVVGADIADPKIPQLPTAYAVLLIIGIQYYISKYIIKNRKFGKLLTFGPTVIIQNGQFIKKNMKRVRYSIENVLMLLREKEVFDINEVEFAIIEDNGALSILKKSQYIPLTPNHMSMSTKHRGVNVPVIKEGNIYEDNLQLLNLNKFWLETELAKNNIFDINEVLYADINPDGKLYISKGENPDDFTKVIQ